MWCQVTSPVWKKEPTFFFLYQMNVRESYMKMNWICSTHLFLLFSAMLGLHFEVCLCVCSNLWSCNCILFFSSTFLLKSWFSPMFYFTIIAFSTFSFPSLKPCMWLCTRMSHLCGICICFLLLMEEIATHLVVSNNTNSFPPGSGGQKSWVLSAGRWAFLPGALGEPLCPFLL